MRVPVALCMEFRPDADPDDSPEMIFVRKAVESFSVSRGATSWRDPYFSTSAVLGHRR